MNRRYFAVLLISGILLAAAVPLAISFSNPSAGVDSFSEEIRIFYGSRNEIEDSRPRYVLGEVVIKFRRGVAEGEIAGLRIGQGAEEVYVSPFTFARVWRVPPSKTVEEWVGFFGKHPLVEYAEPNYYRYALWYPNDPYYVYQWHFDDDHTENPGGASSNPYGGANGGGIRMEEAWAITNGTSNVVVAVIDTGVAYEDYPIPSYESNKVKGGVTDYQKAPDLAGTSFWQNDDETAGNEIDDDGNGFVDDVNGWDFINNDAHPNDNNAHGTHVTGTIAQTTNNGLGVAGIAFNTTIMPVKVLNYAGEGTDAGVADGIYYAVNNGAKVINLSLGGPDPSTTLENAVAYAYNHGVVVIAASGNDGTESVDYPAAYDDYVIAVGATRYDETRVSYSDYGPSLDLVAPGGDVDVDQNGDGYADGVLQQTFKPYEGLGSKADPTDWAYYFFEGTSMATPHVSGVAALLLAQDSALTPDGIRKALESTAEDLGDSGRDDFYGWGLIDAMAALQSIAPLSAFPWPFTANTRIIIPISDPHGPCGAAHTMDTMGGILIANRLGIEGGTVGTDMDSYSYISTYDFGTAKVTMTDTTSNLVVLASPGVNQVAYYYNELSADGTRVLPVLFLRDGQGDYLYVQSNGHEYRIEKDGEGHVTAEYGVIQIHPDGERDVLLAYGLGGECSKAAAKVVANYDQWSLSGRAAIVKYYDSDADGYLDTIEIVETVP